MPKDDAPGKQGNAVKQPPTRTAQKPLHERREVRDFPMLRELSVVDAVKLKGHRVDPSSSGFEANEFAFVRPADGVQDGDTVALGDDRRNRQLQIRKGGTKPSEVLLEGFPPGTLPSQMIVVILRDHLVEHPEDAAFNGGARNSVWALPS